MSNIQQISGYPVERVTLADDDLFDVSVLLSTNPDVWQSQRIKSLNLFKGTGVDQQVAFWKGAREQAGDNALLFNYNAAELKVNAPTRSGGKLIVENSTNSFNAPMQNYNTSNGNAAAVAFRTIALGIGSALGGMEFGALGINNIVHTGYGQGGDGFFYKGAFLKNFNFVLQDSGVGEPNVFRIFSKKTATGNYDFEVGNGYARVGFGKEVRFGSVANTNYVGFKAATVLVQDTIWTLPQIDGTNGQAMVTNGSGGLSFASVSDTISRNGTLAIQVEPQYANAMVTAVRHRHELVSVAINIKSSTTGQTASVTTNTTVSIEVRDAAGILVSTIPAQTILNGASSPTVNPYVLPTPLTVDLGYTYITRVTLPIAGIEAGRIASIGFTQRNI